MSSFWHIASGQYKRLYFLEIKMALLDFSEIPPSKSPSSDVSAFEKFAKDFFIAIYGAVVEKTVGRGPDGGADIVIRVGNERWLVSCKNYSKGSIPRDDEKAPLGDMQQWGCQQFIGFYNPEPSSGLEAKLRQTKENNPTFKCQIFDNEDIERNLIATASSDGWMLAFRWLPKSFSRIATTLVLPFSEYSKDHVVNREGSSRINGIPTTMHYPAGNIKAAETATEELVSFANELATERVFSTIFIERIKDFCLVVPCSFVRPSFIPDNEVRSSDLFPSWDIKLIKNICSAKNRFGLRTLSIVWSFWNLRLAQAIYIYGRILIDKGEDLLSESDSTTIGDVADAVEKYEKEGEYSHRIKGLREELSLAEIALSGRTAERGYYASLLCFCPSGLHAAISKEYALSSIAGISGEEHKLRKSIKTLILRFDEDDKKYVENKGTNLLELLISVNVIDVHYIEKLALIDPSLKCLSMPHTETWRPTGLAKDSIANTLGFSLNE
ncbi:restriction endonuclease [Pseudomonas frederiksbergensis]|uniref:restriction endonuclease n=1 Tax=Pseudomonas frederiksbergensis TaxID=104087 RepID=UPI0016130AEE|nr:restriction endonuclease [Pseudomonas frederiksbergensis]